MKPVILIGGGAAGLAAACELAEAGRKILLLERTPRLGGRAASFVHRRVGEELDYGQHVLMRCCTETIDLFQRLGMERSISFQERVHVPLACGSQQAFLRSARLPGPLHLIPSLLKYRRIIRWLIIWGIERKMQLPLSACSAFFWGVVSPQSATTPPETVKASVLQGEEGYATA